MLRALLGILRGDDPLQAIGERFERMLTLTQEMTLAAGEVAFGGDASPARRTQIYERDVEVNLERKPVGIVTLRDMVLRHSEDWNEG